MLISFLFPFVLLVGFHRLLERMGNVESSSYQKHLLRFLPDELADIENVFGALSGPDEAVGAKAGKAAKKAVTLGMLKAREDGVGG